MLSRPDTQHAAMSALGYLAAVALLLACSGAQGGRVALHRAVCPVCTPATKNCTSRVTGNLVLSVHNHGVIVSSPFILSNQLALPRIEP